MKHFRTLHGLIPLASVLITATAAHASNFSDCFEVAKHVYILQYKAVKACAHAGSGFNDCYKVAPSIFPLQHEKVLKVCVNAGSEFNECFEVAKHVYLFETQAIEACTSSGD